jgi:hypothetical protein
MTRRFGLARFGIPVIASSLIIGAPAAVAARSMAPVAQTQTTSSYVFKLSIWDV